MRSISALAAALLALASPVHGQQVRFTGRTTIDDVVIRDVLRQILTVAIARENCAALETVAANLMPEDYQPPAAYRSAATRFERWDVTMCGRTIPFLLGFWQPPEGGTMFQIGYPFPR